MLRCAKAAAFVALFYLGACAARGQTPASAAIDWARAPVIVVRLANGFFQPGVVTLRAGQPVRLVFENDGVGTHDFVTRLFGFVATRPGTRTGGVRVILQVAEQVEYDIVPQQPGTYALYSIMFEPPSAAPSARFEVK